ncbi:MAG TPA: glycoside hydrolase family 3 N-terminal domain-containing protein, partial [Acidobacteriaceae bacterium]|nr:glycoside hydrolase family 3 N-terminal domain-containing protein [Acidobacteriaceae bacterium]
MPFCYRASTRAPYWVGFTLSWICLCTPLPASAQNGAPYAAPVANAGAVRPSNAQLASPEIERKVDALVRQMTLEEKLGQLVQYGDTGDSANAQLANDNQAPGKNPETHIKIDPMELAATGRLGSMLNVVGAERTNTFQRAAVEKSRLHIPLLFGADILHGYRTIYPIPLGLAATFDPDLVSSVSHVSAQEATTAGVRWFYSPMVDISRDPRWGRTQEGAGEDAYLGAAMARAYIHGYQGEDLSRADSVAASVKHFAAYGAAEAGREYNTTDMSLSRLQQDYLPPYKAAVKAGAATIMSAFNALNGVPSTANPYLLHDVLRRNWGFDGFVVSDYTSVMELRNHGIALDAATATRKAFLAGVDVDMMSHYYDTQLPGLIRSGQVSMSEVDEAVRRVLRVKFALGLFEHPYARGKEVTAAVAENRPLVRKAAEESLVLLQNKSAMGASPLLPFTS